MKWRLVVIVYRRHNANGIEVQHYYLMNHYFQRILQFLLETDYSVINEAEHWI